MKSDFLLAFNEIAEVRKLPREVIMEALQAALISAYRRNTGVSSAQHVEARVDDETGMPTIWVEKEIVEQVQNKMTEIALEDALKYDPEAVLGDMIIVESTPRNFGRIATQTAKQVILQRMREAERESQYQEYQERIGDLVTGTVQSTSGGVVTIGLGRTEAILPPSQQQPGEHYRVHSKVRAYVMDVKKTNRGPQIVVSRTHRNMLRRLLEYEVPEIFNGTVEIKSIAREPGARSKVAVAAVQEGADPVGACVGMRGVRIQSIVKELNNEKIDVIEWNPDTKLFISKALSPARVSNVFLDDDPDEGRTAIVVVPDDQLSLAIGREGQNARLAAKLTGWRIDIKSITEAAEEAMQHLLTENWLADLAKEKAEAVETVTHVLEKKEANRPIMPEDYETLVSFIRNVEDYRLSLIEASHAERRSHIEAARAKVPEAAYSHPLDNTDLPLRVYNILSEAGYETVGEVMEKYYIDAQQLLDLQNFGQAALESVEEMIDTTEFIELEPEEEAVEITEEGAEAIEAVDEAEVIEAADAADEEAEALEAQPETAAPTPGQANWDDWEEEEQARARRAALVAELVQQPDGEAPELEDVVEEAVAASQEIPEPAAAEPEEFASVEEPSAQKPEQTSQPAPALDDFDDEDEFDEATRKRRDKQRRRQLIYDEELGRVVAKRRRKRGDKEEWDEWKD